MSDHADHDPKLLPTLQSGGSVRAIIPQDFDSAYRIAKAVCVAGMAPFGLDTAEKATVAILHGLEVGLSPMIALQSIAVINGRPSLWGDGAMGLVQSSGKLETIKEWIDGEGDKRTAYCRVIRRGDPEPKIGKFSVADAKLAKLWGKTGKTGQPTPWVTHPDRMLQMRARAFALRDAFADVLRGLAIAEEMRDVETTNAQPVVQPAKPTETAPAKPAATAKPKEAAKPAQVSENTGKNVVDAQAEDIDFTRGEPEPGTVEQDEADAAEAGEVIYGRDAEGNVLTSGDLLSALHDALSQSPTAAACEEVFGQHDLMAIFSGKAAQDPDSEQNMQIANGMLATRLREIKKGGK